jgi:hypothetical protein
MPERSLTINDREIGVKIKETLRSRLPGYVVDGCLHNERLRSFSLMRHERRRCCRHVALIYSFPIRNEICSFGFSPILPSLPGL